MVKTVAPLGREGRTMGFQSADAADLGRALLHMDGVSGVWLLSPTDRDLLMWVTVRGFDESAALRRQAVYDRVESFLDRHMEDIRASDFVFDYFVLVDDDELGEAQIPAAAEPVAA
jgi:hypothetical protein